MEFQPSLVKLDLVAAVGFEPTPPKRPLYDGDSYRVLSFRGPSAVLPSFARTSAISTCGVSRRKGLGIRR